MDSHLKSKFSLIFFSLLQDDFISINKHSESRFTELFKAISPTHSSPLYSTGSSEDNHSFNSLDNQDSIITSKIQWTIDTEKILAKGDIRTTLMLKNIPNKYSREKLLKIFNEKFKDSYDIFIMPTDSYGTKNFGYAFINFKHYLAVVKFFQEFQGSRWAFTNSLKTCSIFYSKIQGKNNLVNHYPAKHVYLNDDNDSSTFFP